MMKLNLEDSQKNIFTYKIEIQWNLLNMMGITRRMAEKDGWKMYDG